MAWMRRSSGAMKAVDSSVREDVSSPKAAHRNSNAAFVKKTETFCLSVARSDAWSLGDGW